MRFHWFLPTTGDGTAVRNSTVRLGAGGVTAAHRPATTAYLAQVALRLLRINYDLPDGRWTALIEFEGLTGMLGMTLQASDVAATAFEVGRAILGPAERGWPAGGSLN